MPDLDDNSYRNSRRGKDTTMLMWIFFLCIAIWFMFSAVNEYKTNSFRAICYFIAGGFSGIIGIVYLLNVIKFYRNYYKKHGITDFWDSVYAYGLTFVVIGSLTAALFLFFIFIAKANDPAISLFIKIVIGSGIAILLGIMTMFLAKKKTDY